MVSLWKQGAEEGAAVVVGLGVEDELDEDVEDVDAVVEVVVDGVGQFFTIAPSEHWELVVVAFRIILPEQLAEENELYVATPVLRSQESWTELLEPVTAQLTPGATAVTDMSDMSDSEAQLPYRSEVNVKKKMKNNESIPISGHPLFEEGRTDVQPVLSKALVPVIAVQAEGLEGVHDDGME